MKAQPPAVTVKTKEAASQGLVTCSPVRYNGLMVSVKGKLIDPWHVELTEPVPPGEDSIQVHLVDTETEASASTSLLTQNPAFDFLRDEPDLYE